jgi:hypothetical protein
LSGWAFSGAVIIFVLKHPLRNKISFFLFYPWSLYHIIKSDLPTIIFTIMIIYNKHEWDVFHNPTNVRKSPNIIFSIIKNWAVAVPVFVNVHRYFYKENNDLYKDFLLYTFSSTHVEKHWLLSSMHFGNIYRDYLAIEYSILYVSI